MYYYAPMMQYPYPPPNAPAPPANEEAPTAEESVAWSAEFEALVGMLKFVVTRVSTQVGADLARDGDVVGQRFPDLLQPQTIQIHTTSLVDGPF